MTDDQPGGPGLTLVPPAAPDPAAPRKARSTLRAFFGMLFMCVGGLAMLFVGGCTLVFLEDMSWFLAALVFNIPIFAIGAGLFFTGRHLWRR
jgi:lipopolysaccharide export LptBFGC system permease protein LptF